MNIILKHRVKWMGSTYIELSPNADILDAQLQDGDVSMWVQVDPDESTLLREFLMFPTGAQFPDMKGYHIATIQDGQAVWHLYEKYEE